MWVINLFEYWTVSSCCVSMFAGSCEIEINAPADGGQWRVAERNVRKKQKKSHNQRAPVTRYYLIKRPSH